MPVFLGVWVLWGLPLGEPSRLKMGVFSQVYPTNRQFPNCQKPHKTGILVTRRGLETVGIAARQAISGQPLSAFRWEFPFLRTPETDVSFRYDFNRMETLLGGPVCQVQCLPLSGLKSLGERSRPLEAVSFLRKRESRISHSVLPLQRSSGAV
jgi:hypothetical protein